MLCLQVTAPEHLIVKLVIVLFQNLNGLGIGHMAKFRVYHMVQPFNQSLIHKLVKEVHFFRRIFQYISNNILDHGFCQKHIIL